MAEKHGWRVSLCYTNCDVDGCMLFVVVDLWCEEGFAATGAGDRVRELMLIPIGWKLALIDSVERLPPEIEAGVRPPAD